MPRIKPIEYENTSGELRAVFEKGLSRFGRLTNMKRTLLHSVKSYQVLMEWYTLFDVIKEFLGERLAVIFSHAISSESDCLICTTFMRRILIEQGENPDELYERAASFFNDEQIVSMTAFAGLMVATNIINNVLKVDLDEYLYDFRKGQPIKNEKK
jgi:hypothetical protein